MRKILTIIVPTYNMEALLKSSLNSLIVNGHLLYDLEVLVINDGSKDNSLSIAQEFEEKYHETFRVIDKVNGNYGSCINRGLSEAIGKYVKVMDADDSFDTENLCAFIEYLKTIDSDVVISNFDIVNERGAITKKVTFPYKEMVCFEKKELNRYPIFYLWHHALTYRVDLLKQADYKQTEGCSYSDDEWVYKPLSLAKTFVYFNKTVYKYLIGREGQTVNSVNFSKLKFGKLKVMSSLLSFYYDYYPKFDQETQIFMDNKIIERLDSLYKNLLYRFYDNNSGESVRLLDIELKEKAPNLYEKLASVSIKYTGIQYVKLWRNSGYFDNILVLKLMRFIKK